MKALKLIFPVLFLVSVANASAQDILESTRFSIQLNQHGQIISFYDKTVEEGENISFRHDCHAGFSFKGVILEKKDSHGAFYYEGEKEGILYHLQYSEEKEMLKIEAGVVNKSGKMFLPTEGVCLHTGINTYMEKYPDWDEILFPTMQRCERTHFISYFMSPSGKILVMASPDPIASWCNEYEIKQKTTEKGRFNIGQHRIFTTSLYLLHRLPLPERHPQDLFYLAPGAEKKITIYLQTTNQMESIQPILHNMTQAPILSADLYTLGVGETFHGHVLVKHPMQAEIRTPRGEVQKIELVPESKDCYKWSYQPFSGEGEYTFSILDQNGKLSEMKLFSRPQCTRYLDLARKEGLRSQPTSTHHAECFYPFYTYFLSRRFVPSEPEDRKANHVFDSLYPLLYDRELGEMKMGKPRLQDAATMAGILSDRFQVTGKEDDLEQASRLVDYLISCQGADGALYVPGKHIHYSSVIYPLKSMIEVADEEKNLSEHKHEWKKRFHHHQQAIIQAIDNLALLGDNIGTEGQMTFEDGMISCSISQLALGALKFPENRETYLKQAEHLYQKHRCLTQNLIPDCRMNGATLRFWEYQYAVNLMHNALNSPCGWTAWKLYADWYLYLLTGKHQYMKDFLNGIGSAMQLLDIKTGELRFSFLADPFIDAGQFTETPADSHQPVLHRIIVGEQYISQTSSWHYNDPYAWRPTKFGIDNFVHEVFKCMSETLLENAFIIEDENGLHGINCHLTQDQDKTIVTYADTTVRHLHVNLLHTHRFQINDEILETASGMRWMTEIPSSVKPY